MSTWLNISEIRIEKILETEEGELRELINLALMDAVTDSMDRYKDDKKPRSVQINLDLRRMEEELQIDWKVVPKLAPYERKPAKESVEKVPEGQIRLFDDPEEDPLG